MKKLTYILGFWVLISLSFGACSSDDDAVSETDTSTDTDSDTDTDTDTDTTDDGDYLIAESMFNSNSLISF